jgi:imidazolonepropionase-like amidohydrolase
MQNNDNPLTRSEVVMDLAPKDVVLLRNGRILKDGRLEPGSIWIKEGIIQEVVWGENVPKEIDPHASVLDLDNRVIMPGLIDLHTHNTGRVRTEPFAGQLPIGEFMKMLRAAAGLGRTLEAGFTTVRSLGHGSAELVEQLKTAIQQDLILGPRVVSCGWAISQTGGHGNLHGLPYEWVEEWKPRSAFADGSVGCREMVRRNFALGADVIKIYVSEGLVFHSRQDIPNFTLEEILAITDEAHLRGKRVAAHAIGDQNVWRAIQGGVDTIEHGEGTSDKTLKEMAERGRTLVSTLSVPHRFDARSGQTGGPDSRGSRQAEVIQRAYKLGVKIGFGTDSGTYVAGQNAEELIHLVNAGLSPCAAIESATIVAAEALGMEDRLGRVENGYVADLLVVDTDPLQDISSLSQPGNIWRVLRSRQNLG